MGGERAQTRMVDALFAAFFEKERDIGCYDYLSVAAETTGLMTAETVSRSSIYSSTLLLLILIMAPLGQDLPHD